MEEYVPLFQYALFQLCGGQSITKTVKILIPQCQLRHQSAKPSANDQIYPIATENRQQIFEESFPVFLSVTR